ncbi:MAG: sugar-binding domain-containing protein [Massilia sp.]
MHRILRTALLSACAAMALAALPASAQRASTSVKSPRQSFSFNQGWQMKTGDDPAASKLEYDDAAWTKVNLPHAFNETEAFAVNGARLSAGVTWYRKRFALPAGVNPAHALIEFEGVRQAAEVWVNGERIGLNENGVMAFGFDIARALKPGSNLIAVRVDSDWKYKERATGTNFQWVHNSFNANYGGINHPVSLHLTGDLYQTLPLYSSLGTTGAYIYGDQYDIAGKAATIHAESEVKNDSAAARSIGYGVVVRDLDGKVVARFDSAPVTIAPGQSAILKAQRRVKGLNFWSWGYGYLYTVTTTLSEKGKVVDAVDTRTGFRSTEFANGMVKLNGRVLQMKGYAQRSTNEWPAVGVTVPPWVSDFGNKLMLESNANLVRWMHITPNKQDVESSDRLGLIEAMPAGDAERDVAGRQWEQRVDLMRDAIIYNRNNPSILFYEGGNTGITEAHMSDLKSLRDKYDPHGGRAAGSREMLDSKVAEYGGEMLYINKSKGKPFWAMEYSRDEAARAFQDDFTPPFHKDAPAYNRNVESIAVENIQRWWDFYRYRPGTGERVSSGGVNIGFTDSNSHFRGDNNYRRSGEVDPMRIPKDSLWVHRVMWDGWVDASSRETFIIGHWNYAPGTTKTVYVASAADSVELLRNGRSLGKGVRSDGFLHTFKDVAFEAGELKAVSTFADGKTTSDARKTAGAPAAIRLTPRTGPRGFMADGNDLLMVDVAVVDQTGQVVPTAMNAISFKLDGAAVWKGGVAQKGEGADKAKSDNYVLATTLPVELGLNRVLVRSTNQAGTVKLVASAEGLAPAAIDVVSKPVVAVDGLSTVFPQDAQPVNLTRGPTPLTRSYTDTVRSLPVVAISAGSNQANARNSHDDNERSAWNSDGSADGAWIEYDLGTPQKVSALSLKLTGWRLRTYVLKVTLDGVTVFAGEVPKSLGYADLDFPVARRRKLRIALTKGTEDRDAFGAIVELKSDRDAYGTGAEKVATGMKLSVVEADILGPVGK